MKNTFLTLAFYLALLTLSFSSCQKQVSQELINKQIITNVNTWLQKQKSAATETNNAKIQQLESRLDYDHIRLENSEKGEKFIIIPIKTGLETIANNAKSSATVLFLIESNQGQIRKGHIAIYIPDNPQTGTSIPENSFYNIFNVGAIPDDGQFSFYNLTGNLLFRLVYKDGLIKSSACAKPAAAPAVNGVPRDPIGPAPSCTDWYLVTTYYYLDGTSDQTEEYLYTTCEPGGGGGGGDGNGNDTDYEYDVEFIAAATLHWNVLTISTDGGGGQCQLTYQLYAKMHNIHSEKDKFHNCYLIRSDVLSNSHGGTSSISTSNTTGLNTANLTISVAGKVTFPDASYIPFNNSGSWQLGNFGWNH